MVLNQCILCRRRVKSCGKCPFYVGALSRKPGLTKRADNCHHDIISACIRCLDKNLKHLRKLLSNCKLASLWPFIHRESLYRGRRCYKSPEPVKCCYCCRCRVTSLNWVTRWFRINHHVFQCSRRDVWKLSVAQGFTFTRILKIIACVWFRKQRGKKNILYSPVSLILLQSTSSYQNIKFAILKKETVDLALE